jgi:hypothetical protein
MATPLPSISSFNQADTTEAEFKVALAAMRTYLASLLTASGELADARRSLGVAGNEVVGKSANYTLTVDDCGKTFVWTGTTARTASFTAAATLGNGWTAEFVNKMTANLTLDPNASEEIDGATTFVVPPGGRAIVRCDGTGFVLVAKIDNSLVTSFNTRTGAVTLSSGDVTTALGFTPANSSHTHSYVATDSHSLAVGSYGLAQSGSNPDSAGITQNTTFPGASYGLSGGTWRRA